MATTPTSTTVRGSQDEPDFAAAPARAGPSISSTGDSVCVEMSPTILGRVGGGVSSRAVMPLESIREPGDLRNLSYEELDELAGEILDFVVHAVAESAGHLGSNLGAVELTLALHRVFESPRDAVLWDTGHQAYVHKIVTGRQSGFETLREANGLSGYPSREESKHDFVENSHASTILSYAYGLAVARDSGADPE